MLKVFHFAFPKYIQNPLNERNVSHNLYRKENAPIIIQWFYITNMSLASSAYNYKMRLFFCILKKIAPKSFSHCQKSATTHAHPPNDLQLFLRRSQDASCYICTEGQAPTLILPFRSLCHLTSTAHYLPDIYKHRTYPSSATYCCCSQPYLRSP